MSNSGSYINPPQGRQFLFLHKRTSVRLFPFGIVGHAMELLFKVQYEIISIWCLSLDTPLLWSFVQFAFVQYAIISIWSHWTRLVASAMELLFNSHLV